MSKPNYIKAEPGLLEAFRFYVAFRILASALYFLLTPYILSSGIIPSTVAIALFIGVINGLLIIGYLSVEWFQRALKDWFLPVAFIYATIDALIIEKLLSRGVLIRLVSYASSLATDASVDIAFTTNGILFDPEIWRFSPPLFILLILISWQYPLSRVLIFALFTALVDMLYPLTYGVSDQQTLYIAVGLLARTGAFVLMAVIVTNLVRVQREQRQQLTDANARLTSYAAVSEQLAISRERNRLARELHDTLAHSLSASSVQLEAVNSLWDSNPTKAYEMLQRVLNTTRNGLTETRRALQSLRASPLEDLGLLFALRDLAETTGQRTGSEITIELPEEIGTVQMDAEQTIYRIAQEALENIVRHANAKHIALSLERHETTLSLKITDDGYGFDVAKTIDTNNHYGIKGMNERIDALGGKLIIDSSPGKGTSVVLEMEV